MRAVVPKQSCELATELDAKVRRYAGASLAESTRSTYRRHFGFFTTWCKAHGRASIPASVETVTLYLADVADRYRPDTLSGFLSVIAHAHRAAGHTFDRTNFKVILEGIHRTYGSPSRQKTGITIDELRALVVSLPDTLMGARDRVILTLGFAAALRPGELVGLDIGRAAANSTGSVEITPEGLRLTLSRTQVDETPIVKAVPRGGSPCPVEALERWLALADIVRGPVLRQMNRSARHLEHRRLHRKAVDRIVKRTVYAQAVQAGMHRNAARARASRFSGYSLRVGFVTSAVRAGASSESIARHVGWKTMYMMAQYRRKGGLFHKHPVQRVLAS